jgi:hypothetical protein
VLEGSVVMQVKGGEEITLTPGQSFYEGAGQAQHDTAGNVIAFSIVANLSPLAAMKSI